MKKIVLLTSLAALVIILAGCQNVGEALKGRFGSANQPVNENVNQPAENLNQPATINPATKEVKYNNIFFGSKKYDPQSLNCGAVYWVHLTGDQSVDPIERNLKLLLAGPGEKWAAKEYFTVIPAGVKLNSVKLEGETVYADFSAELNTLAGSCAVTMARQQIEQTAKYAASEHLDVDVKKVVISVNGDSETALQP